MILKNNLLNTNLCLAKAEVGLGHRVADLGCGRNGYFIFPLADMVGENGCVYAVDVVRGVVDDIKKRATEERRKQVQAIWGNIENLNSLELESSSVDIAFLINTMHQLDNHISAIRETNRILKEKGKLVVVDWKMISNGFGPIMDRRLNKDNIMDFAYRAGLDFVEEFDAGDFHYGLIFKKAL